MLVSRVQQFLSSLGFENKTIWIAFSGGMDSHVLLSLCHAIRKEHAIQLRAIHINHNLSPYASIWMKHCEHVCKDYEIEFVTRTIQIDSTCGDSLEELARDKRYAVFAECMGEGDVLLTAHQQDDQAETMLLQLFRGAGLKGLAAMPSIKSFARGIHARPLLSVTRDEINDYAESQHLKWIEDESNQNIKFSRNFIRHEIVPQLKKHWPSVTQTISRSAQHCAEAQYLLQEFVDPLLQTMQGSQAKTVSVQKLLSQNDAMQRLLLRTWISKNAFPIPDTSKIETIRHDVLTAAHDRMPCVMWEGTELRRFRDDLYLMPALPPHEFTHLSAWNFAEPLALPGIGTLSASLVPGKGIRSDIKQVSIGFRRGGEIAAIPGRGNHTLKNLMQEWEIPPWLRDRIPLIFANQKLIGAVGYFVDADYATKEDEMGYEVVVG